MSAGTALMRQARGESAAKLYSTVTKTAQSNTNLNNNKCEVSALYLRWHSS